MYYLCFDRFSSTRYLLLMKRIHLLCVCVAFKLSQTSKLKQVFKSLERKYLETLNTVPKAFCIKKFNNSYRLLFNAI